MKINKFFAFGLVFVLLMSLMGVFPVAAASGVVRQISNSGSGSPITGEFVPSGGDGTSLEFPASEQEEGPDAYNGIVDRSFSSHTSHGVAVNSGKKAKSNPAFNKGFEGLNLFQQRYARGGNQFTVEPPDQGLCAGNGYVLEAVNDVLNVFNTSGQSVLPDNTATNIVAGFPTDVNHAVDLNSFYGYGPAVNRTTGARAQFVTDPSCLYDAATQRWFVVVLTLESLPNGALPGPNHIDIAVSKTSDPTGAWNIYRVPVQDDGTQGTPDHGCPANNDGTGHGPCLGDYPHIGADANGFYVTTNEYAFFPDFVYMGAQVYAFSKAQLAAGAANVTMVQFDTSHMGVGGHPGFTVWPAQSPGTQFSTANGGTEYFMSSDAGDEAQCDSGVPCAGGTGTSTNLLVWTLTNTTSLNSASPTLSLSNNVLTVGQYGVPPRQHQPGTGSAPGLDVPQGYCLNDETTLLFNGLSGCYRLLVSTAVHNATKPEVVMGIDSNDSRMQQVMYANGKLWGALDTALTVGGSNRAGIEWFIVNPSTPKLLMQGYLGVAGMDFTYPAIGVTASGRGIMAFTATGDTVNPSAGYASIDSSLGLGAWNIVPGGEGKAPDDGFTGYKAQRFPNPIRPRWGDYGAAAVDGNSIWLASEYVAHACDYAAWGGSFFASGSGGDNKLGTCAASPGAPGLRTALGNWSTFISKFTP